MYTLGDVTYKGTPFYTSTGSTNKSEYAKINTVNFDMETGLYYSDKGPYNTFFHECGHAIDYQLGDNNYYSRQYMDGTNFDVISGDVYGKIESEIREYCAENRETIPAEQEDTICENIIQYIKDVGYGSETLNNTEEEVLLALKDRMKEQLNEKGSYEAESPYVNHFKAYIRAGISDVYGGVTNNVIVGDRGHKQIDEKDTDGDGNIDEYTYWYDIESPYERKGTQEMEMWAHYFSFGITENDEALGDMRIYLDNSMKRYDEMAQSMIDSL